MTDKSSWGGEERRTPSGSAWEGPERRSDQGILDLVSRASHQAAQEVGRIHRRRLVTQSFLAALLVSALVSVGVVLLSSHTNRVAATSNAAFNCEQGDRYATIISDFVKSDQKLRHDQAHFAHRAQVIAAFSRILQPKLLRELTARSDRLDARTNMYWRTSIIPRLQALADVNCNAVITQGGAHTTETMPKK